MNVIALIIGDEILSGRRQDKHMTALMERLGARGMGLARVEYLGDDPAAIADAIRRARDAGLPLFSFGGIGATPDDHTRAAAAAALGVELEIHPDARAIIEERFGAEAYPHRIEMGRFPRGATLIPNPVNQIPGFSCGKLHFVPGFPSMAWPMLEWVLDTRYAGQGGVVDVSRSVIVVGVREGDLVGLMQDFVARYPALRLFSLPSFGNERIAGVHVELGFTGPAAEVEPALNQLRQALAARGHALAEAG